MTNENPLATPLRITSSAVFLAGLILAVVHVVAMSQPGPGELFTFAQKFGPAFGMLAGGWVLSLLLWRSASTPSPAARVPPVGDAAVASVQATIGQLRAELAALNERIAELGVLMQTPTAAPVGSAADPEAIAQLQRDIEDIRALVMMTDQQRQTWVGEQVQAAKRAGLERARAAVASRQWAQAEELVVSLERDCPGDAEVAALRGELEKGRGLVEAEAVRAAAASIEDLMATAQWNQALAEANRLAESFPKNAEARALLQRVVRERDLYRDSTTRQLWDEVKRQVERRAWRKALAAARRLSEQFPEHKLAQRVQGQLPTIAENAEIEERHEREQEIQNLVGRKRFSDAADLAEELIARFPHSPQAQKLQDMLPMLRQRAAQQSVAR
jgi:hypothetical protein